MTNYKVTWEIDIEADSPREAAEQALTIQRRVGSSAVVFDVVSPCGCNAHVDLDEPTYQPSNLNDMREKMREEIANTGDT